MKQEKEYLDHATPKHQERQDQGHLQFEKLMLLQLGEPNQSMLEEEPTGFIYPTMEEERQAQPLRPSENTSDREVWWNEENEENLTANSSQSLIIPDLKQDVDRHREDRRRKIEEFLLQTLIL